MASNKVATVVLLDVGVLVSGSCGNETFFKKSQWCLLRIIQRKIFSDENDELAVVLFGCEETENNLALLSDEGMYKNIYWYIPMQKCNWDLYEKIQKLTTTEIKNSNWVEGLVASLDYLKDQIKGKRFKDKQVVVLSNFEMELQYNEKKVDILVESFNLDNIKLVAIGVDLEEECKDKVLDSQLSGSIGLMFSLIDKVENGVSLSFNEAEDDIVYYERKRKMLRFTKVNLTIGSKINIPIRWIKINLDPTRIKWARKPPPRSKVALSRKETPSEPEIRFIMETQKTTKFGNSEVTLNYADVEAMKRKTGPASCILLGCVRTQRIHRKMFVGKDLYLVVPEKAPHAQAMISAFIDALIEADKYALVRRISVNNGKVKLGLLIPVSNENSKELYFLQLPFAEYAMVVPEILLPEPNDSELLETFDNLIDAMTIPDKPKDLPMKDPTFQLRCHVLQLYQTGQLHKESDHPPLPDFIKNLCDPYPELNENALHIVEKLEKLLPIQIDEKMVASDQVNTSLKGVENIFQEKDSTAGVFMNKSEISTIKGDDDWENAETQDWPEELKDKYKSPTDIKIPNINLKEDVLSRSKYEKNYVSDRIWKEYGTSDKSRVNEYPPDVQQMIQERQNTDCDVDTAEMLLRIKSKLERK